MTMMTIQSQVGMWLLHSCTGSARTLRHGDPSDNAMTAMISFPQVLGHEVVGERVDTGQRVVLNPWLSCEPRGISPVCPQCAAGNLSLCANFDSGSLAPGLHLGNCQNAPGA